MKNEFRPIDESASIIKEIVLPVFEIINNKISPLGTSFVLSDDGLLMTAKHVIERHTQIKTLNIKNGLWQDVTGLYALYQSDIKHPDRDAFLGGPIPVVRIWFSKELDIAYLWLRSFSLDDKPFKFPACVKLNFDIPIIEDFICAIGYHNSSGSEISTDKEKLFASLEQYSVQSSGRVKEIFSKYRDLGMYSFPCVQVDARFEPGMSGGPIFTKNGTVCGIVCGSMSASNEEDYISYFSILWPSLGTLIEIQNPNEDSKMVSVYDLCKLGKISSDDSIDDFEVTVLENESAVRKKVSNSH